jgi:hypothetical protein
MAQLTKKDIVVLWGGIERCCKEQLCGRHETHIRLSNKLIPY